MKLLLLDSKNQKKTTELSKLNSTCPEEFSEKSLSSLGKKLFLSSIVEAKNIQSSKRKFTTEIWKQKFSRPQEHVQEECFSSKKLGFRKVF